MLRRCRRGLVEKVAAEERRREEAEDELQYQVQRQQRQRQAAAPVGLVYDEINMEQHGYSIPDFVKSDQSVDRSGYAHLSESSPTPPAPQSPATPTGDSEPVETEPHYSRSLPDINDAYA